MIFCMGMPLTKIELFYPSFLIDRALRSSRV